MLRSHTISMKQRVSKINDSLLWEQKLRSIFSNKLIGVGFSDMDKKVLEINHKLAEQLEITENLLKKLKFQHELLKEFAQITSHNLRAPVGNIVGLIELYKNQKFESEEEREMLIEQFENISSDLLETINTVGTALEIQEQTNIKIETIRFEELFESVVKGLTGKSHNLDFELDMDFSSCPEIEYSRTYLKS